MHFCVMKEALNLLCCKTYFEQPIENLVRIAANLMDTYTEDVFFSEYISHGIVFRFGRTGPSKQHEHMKA
jgi:hypothetical protein